MVAAKKSTEKGLQPEINIGLVGHVDHGKTTLLQRLSGKWADTHSEEQKRGITIRLGYANSVFYTTKESYSIDKKAKDIQSSRVVSFIDAPGHETLMATMLSGAATMDGALLLVSAHEECPQPQTKEHLMALDILGIKNIVIVQNKIDLVSKEAALDNYKQIKEFVKGSIAENAPIVPISAVHNVNIDALIGAIEETIPTPKRDLKKDPSLLIARSFDVNKPGSPISKMIGGVLGGIVKQGCFKIGDRIEISPGRFVTEKHQQKFVPLKTKIVGLRSGNDVVEQVVPGGSVALLTSLDSALVKSDQLVGSVVSLPGKSPQAWTALKVESHLLDSLLGSDDKSLIAPICKGEPLMLNVNSATTAGLVQQTSKNTFSLTLKRPVAAEVGTKIAISRRFGSRWRLIGFGFIQK